MKIEILKIKNSNKFFVNLKKYKLQIFITFLLAIISVFFITNSSHYLNVVLEGILLYGTKILPSLLPFLFVTKILSNFDFIFYICSKFKCLTKFLFNTPQISFYIFFMSIISGYPVGAKLTSEFYENNIITKEDAQKILSFCSTSGPLFVIGSVGVGFFASSKIGILLFISHILSSIINGIIFGHSKTKTKDRTNCYKLNNTSKNLNSIAIKNNSLTSQIQKEINLLKFDGEKNAQQKKLNLSLDDCMYNSIRSVLIVGGYIIIFYVFIQIMLDINLLYPLTKLFELLGFTKLEAQGFSAGLFEITKGISILSKTKNLRFSFVLSSFLISFSGLSIIMQSITFLEKTNVNKKVFVIQKLFHAILSSIFAYLLSFFIV